MSLRLYEEMFIVKPDSTDELVDPIIEMLTQLIAKDGGNVLSSEKWGTRKLAYQVGRFREGYYILLKFEATGVTIKEIERRLRVNDLVIKYLTVRLDEEMKWADKRKKRREKRAARKPQVSVMPAAPMGIPASPALPSEAAAPAPGKPTEGMPAPAAPATAAPAAAAAAAAAPVATAPVAAEPVVAPVVTAPVAETPAAEATPAPAAVEPVKA